MSSIEDAIAQLEESSAKLRNLTVEEGRAVKEAVREATKEATAKVKDEFKEKRDAAKQELKEAEKQIKDAKRRIESALQSESNSSGTARRGSRSEALVAFFKANPGASVSDAAKDAGVSANGLYAPTRKLVEDGKLTKLDDGGYKAA